MASVSQIGPLFFIQPGGQQPGTTQQWSFDHGGTQEAFSFAVDAFTQNSESAPANPLDILLSESSQLRRVLVDGTDVAVHRRYGITAGASCLITSEDDMRVFPPRASNITRWWSVRAKGRWLGCARPSSSRRSISPDSISTSLTRRSKVASLR